ncbi:MAG: acyltransferase [Treponema sp.]|jgi:fucose 4-O-acetylase-like acetyltransferase|nr:acyltransferase [Treponema sp.]
MDSTLAITKKRIEYIDLLKCFAIFCVLWYHSIGGLNDAGGDVNSDRYFLADPLHLFFVSFHMPLFFMISGFFFSSSLSFKEVLRKRFTYLIIPHITWSLLISLANWGMTFLSWKMMFYKPFSVRSQLQALIMPNPSTDLWFFKDLFLTHLIVFISCKCFKKRYAAFIASMLFVLLVDAFGIVGKVQRFMMPIFWTGILLKTYYPLICKHLNKLLILSGISFVICLYFFDYTYIIYLVDFPTLINFQQSFAEGKLVFDFTHIGIQGFRLLTGLAGSIFFFALFQRCWRKNAITSFLSRCGQLTVGIYGIQSILLQRIMANILDFSNGNKWLYWLVITPGAAVFAFFACVLIVRLIQRNTRLTFVLFGSSLVERGVVRSDDKEARTVEALVLAARRTEARVAEARAAEALALEALAAAARVVEVRAAEARTAAARVAETRVAETQALEARTAAARVAKAYALEAHALEAQALEARTAEARALEALAAEALAAEDRATKETLLLKQSS